jgi:hypothetical protein
MENKIAEIERMRAEGCTFAEIAKRFGLSRQRICQILKPDRVLAQQAKNRAIKKGIIKIPERCSNCNKNKKLHAHHPDYSKPLDVVWLCPRCHGMAHHRPTKKKKKKSKDKAAALLGSLGGKARARNLSKERLSEIGKMGAAAAWRRKYQADTAENAPQKA